MRATPQPGRRGFSIIEATLAVLLIGGAMVAAMNVAITASRANGAATQRRQAEALANLLLAEVLSMPATGSDATGLNGGVRLNDFDHVLDYHGFTESPPKSIDGDVIAPAGWRWSVAVVSRASETIDASSLNLRMYRVTVTVEMPDGTTVSARGLRGDSTTVERVPVVDGVEVVQMLIAIELPDGSTIHAAPDVGVVRTPNSVQRSGVIQ